MIALEIKLRAKLASTIERHGVNDVLAWLGCDEQTMMRAAIGIPLRDGVAKRIAKVVGEWE
jgi:hypothetical protein